MNIFDLHTDTLSRLLREGLPFSSSVLGWSENDLSSYDSVVLVTAAFSSPDKSDREAYLDFFAMRQLWKRLNVSDGRLTAILSVEDGRILERRKERLSLLDQAGVRILTPFWRGVNCLGGAFDTKVGLTPFGREIVKEAEALGILLDLSHASDASFFEIAERAKRPFIASHSAARAVCPHPRNLTDEEFLFLRERGGLVGLTLYPPHLTEGPEADLTALLSHLEHFLSLGGGDTVALGTDLDGIEATPKGIRSGKNLLALAELLAKEGYPDLLIRKLFYENAHSFFKLNLKKY